MFHFPVFVGLIPLKNRSSHYWLPLSGFKVPWVKEAKSDSVPELWQQGEVGPLLPDETGAKIEWKGKQMWQQKTELGYVITEPRFHIEHPLWVSSWCGLSRTAGHTGTAQRYSVELLGQFPWLSSPSIMFSSLSHAEQAVSSLQQPLSTRYPSALPHQGEVHGHFNNCNCTLWNMHFFSCLCLSLVALTFWVWSLSLVYFFFIHESWLFLDTS